jgi:uncharacterized membrane protein YkvA (DUF1232 family)
MNPKKLIKKYGNKRKFNSSDKSTFFEILEEFFNLTDIEALWHIVTLKNTKCAKEIFTLGDLALIAGAVAYVLMPLDAVPDLIPVAGQLDDATVIGFILRKLGSKIKEFRENCM